MTPGQMISMTVTDCRLTIEARLAARSTCASASNNLLGRVIPLLLDVACQKTADIGDDEGGAEYFKVG